MAPFPDPWALPTPALLVDRVARGFHDGKSAVVRLATGHGHGFAEAVRRVYETGDRWPAPWMDCPTEGGSPAHRVAIALDLDTPDPPVWRLVRDGSRDGQRIVHANLDAREWEGWRPFVYEFAHACIQEDPTSRPILFISIDEASATGGRGEPTLDVIDATRPWTPRDVRVLLTYEVADTSLDPVDTLVSELVIETAVELARGDIDEARRLARRGRGLLGDHGSSTALWKAQVRVLFPVIEEARRRLADKVAAILGPNANGEPVATLEIGPLTHFLVERRHQTPKRLLDHARALREMRNRLAHREPVPLGSLGRLVVDD